MNSPTAVQIQFYSLIPRGGRVYVKLAIVSSFGLQNPHIVNPPRREGKKQFPRSTSTSIHPTFATAHLRDATGIAAPEFQRLPLLAQASRIRRRLIQVDLLYFVPAGEDRLAPGLTAWVPTELPEAWETGNKAKFPFTPFTAEKVKFLKPYLIARC